jgi:regulator of protease activity HflC (stomatin/prohibitin superfamily)
VLDKLLDFLREIWGDLLPIEVISPYNGGVQIRMGKELRTLAGGWYWKVPFADRILIEHIVPRTERLTGLATTTSDDRAIGFDAVITWRISDIRKALMEVVDLKDAIADSCAGIIGTELSNAAWADIVHGNTVEALTAACRKRGWKWGVEIQQVQLTGVAPVKNLRVSLSGHASAVADHIN